MKHLRAGLPSEGAQTAELMDLVGRIGASRHFRRAERLRRFLEFVCQQTLAGNSSEINEHLIGYEVFGRAPAYDPASDNIVRVEARELRKRLETYFADEGSEEALTIRIPTGTYVPVFESRKASLIPRHLDSRHLVAGLAAILLLFIGILFGRMWPASAKAQSREFPLFHSFWTKVFELERLTVLAVADSNLSLLQDIRGESISFSDYTTGRYFAGLKDEEDDETIKSILSLIASRYYTSLADANMLVRLTTLNENRGPGVIRFARDLNIRDLKSRNMILIGSSRSNPWVGLFDENRRFRIEHDTELNRAFLRDSSPKRGKPAIYVCDNPSEGPYESYGIVAAVPNLDGTGHALLIAGTNMQATEAAGEFLTNPGRFDAFLREINWLPDSKLPVFEVVLKLVTMGGSSVANEIIAYEAGELSHSEL